MIPSPWLQPGERGSVTVTSWRVTLPVFVTVILNVAVPPLTSTYLRSEVFLVYVALTFCWFGFLTILIFGSDGGTNGCTFTTAESLSLTFVPFGAVPTTRATFV